MNPLFNLTKLFFPSWKFFDEDNQTPVLLYRLKDQNSWKICFPPPEMRWFHFFYNPPGVLYLAYHSHMEQLLQELNDPDFGKSLTYKITENLVRSLKPANDFQFKVSTIKMQKSNFEILEDFLISPVLPRGNNVE